MKSSVSDKGEISKEENEKAAWQNEETARRPQFSRVDLEFDQPLRDLGFSGVPRKFSASVAPIFKLAWWS